MPDPLLADLVHDELLTATLSEDELLTATLAEDEALTATVLVEETLEARVAEEQGMRGAPGRDGAPGGALSRVTAEPIAGGRVVVSVDADTIAAADARVPDHGDRILGVCMQSAAGVGEVLEVVRLGLVGDDSWSFTPGQPVFCGAFGTLTQAPEGVAFWARVGTAVDATHVFVDVEPPIYL